MEPNPYEAPKEAGDTPPPRPFQISRSGLILIILMAGGTSLVVLDLLFVKYLEWQSRRADSSPQAVSPLR